MDQQLVLTMVEKLEALLGKLPEKIRRPVLHELTPLKELFLQKRAPRLLILGALNKTMPELLAILLELPCREQTADAPLSIFRWQEIDAGGRASLSILDARGAGESERRQIAAELKKRPADIVIFVDETNGKRRARKQELQNLVDCLAWSDAADAQPKVIAANLRTAKTTGRRGKNARHAVNDLAGELPDSKRVLGAVTFSATETLPGSARELMSLIGRALPNEARLEFIRISQDREQQAEAAQVLVKSASAICAAIGAQPIPLADLPILTTLQLIMVSGIMYLSGRERSLRAAAEFMGALGANLGIAMVLREGVRALVKFVPGWGNVVSGMVAGAGTYAMGRAATLVFVEGAPLRDARRIYLRNRRKRGSLALTRAKRPNLPRAGRLTGRKPASNNL